MSTKFTSKEEAERSRKWHVVDASGLTVGRLASEVAILLRGKHKANYTPNTDCGDCVIVTNASKVKFTGGKENKKVYYKHTAFIGNLKSTSAADMLSTKPEFVIEQAVYGMLPKGVLGKHMRKKLKVYAGAEHPHKAQNPETFALKYHSAAQ